MRLFTKSNVATIAIVTGIIVASGTGGAVAGALITGKQIKDGTVTSIDIANGSLTGTDVKTGSVSGGDVKNGTLTLSDLASSARGIRALERVHAQNPPAAANTPASVAADCPAGKVLISASANWAYSNRAIQVAAGTTGATGWTDGSDNVNDVLNLTIVCAAVG